MRLPGILRLVATTLGALALFGSCGDGVVSKGSDAGVGVARTQEGLAAAEWPAETLVVTNSAHVDNQARVTGAITATKAVSQTLSSNAELALGSDSITTGNVKADTLVLRERALVTGSATWNSLSNAGTIEGTSSPPLGLPVPVSLPAMPSISPGTQNVTVNSSQQMTLGSGSYGTLTVNSGNGATKTKLTLSGGSYQLSTLNVMNDARVECAAACEIRVNGRATVGARSFLGPKSGVSGLGAANVILAVKGTNGGSGPEGNPPAAFFDNDSQMHAYLLVTNGTARFGDRAAIVGKVVAKDAWLGQASNTEGRQVPLVTSGPDDVTVAVGQSASFTVAATGTELSYQWQRDGVNIPGATGPDYTLASATLADDGRQFRVIVSNNAGSVTSGTATLTVTAGCAPVDSLCDGEDEDCDESVDEDYVPICGQDPLSPSILSCLSGTVVEIPCDDGDACTGVEGCSAGKCTAGTPVDADDGNSCTQDACDPVEGDTHTPLPPGTPCGGGGVCDSAGQCETNEPSGKEITFTVKLPEGLSRGEVALGATGGHVFLGDHAQLLGSGTGGFASISSVGNYFWTGAHLEPFARVDDVWTEGAATLESYSHVFGNVRAKWILEALGATVDGDQDPNADLRPLEEIQWSVFFPDATQGPRQLAPGETVALLAGAYGAVSVPQGAHVALSAGTYTFESLQVDLGGTIDIDNSSGPVQVYVEGTLDYNGAITRTNLFANVLFGVAGATPLSLEKAFTGILVAPFAEVVLKHTVVEHQGSFFGKALTLKDFAKVRHEPWLTDAFCALAPTSDCDGLCPCGMGGNCVSDQQCAGGLVCGTLGVCTCVGTCAGKTCGDAPSNGCGGLCQDYCPASGQGCTTDIECEGSTVCLGGTCLPPSCGTTSCDPSECGEICGECIPQCSGLECGPDPVCGTPCGDCSDGSVCENGMCLSPEDARPELPPHPGTESGASTVGSLGGQLSATPTGRVNYTLPLELPPARAGVSPPLALNYTGGIAPSVVGTGWVLGGLSSIVRCNKSLALDGWQEAIRGADTAEDPEDRDAICLDGQRLVLVEGEHLRDGARYRTEAESFRDISFHGEGTTSYWEVRGKDGTVERFGPEATWSMMGTTVVPLQWPIALRVLRSGLGTYYGYECRGSSQAGRCFSEPAISSISYGMVTALATPPTHVVRFTYEPRDHAYTGSAIASGTSARLSERIATIDVGGPSGFMHRYRLSYATVNAGVENRGDFLASVTRCIDEPTGEVCLSPTAFHYEAAPSGSQGNEYQEFAFPGEEQYIDWPKTFAGGPVDKSDSEKTAQATAKATLILDWNGDGRLDFLHPNHDGDWALTVGVMVPGALLLNGSHALGFDMNCVSPSSIVDLNGDGRSDVLEGCPLPSGEFVIRLSTGNLDTPFTTVHVPATGHDSVFALDVNADGLPELITCTAPSGSGLEPDSLLLGNFGGVLGTPSYLQVGVLPTRDAAGRLPYCVWRGGSGSTVSTREPPFLADLDADGAQNILDPPYSGQGGQWPRQFLSIRRGLKMQWIETDAQALTSWPMPARSLDVDGDGLVDTLLAEAYYPDSGHTIPPRDVPRVADPLSLGYRTTLYLNRLHGSMRPIALYLPRIEEGLTEVEDTTDPLASGVTHELFNGMRIMDVDRDGRDELVAWRRSSAGNSLWRFSNEEPNATNPTSMRFRARVVFRVTPPDDRFTERGIAPLIADFDADGATDMLTYSVDDNTVRLYRGYQPQRFLLRQVSDGLGNRALVTYGGSNIYEPGTECSVHTRCLPAVGPLVQSLRFYDASGRLDAKTEFSYADARVGRYGRGPLGFGKRILSEFGGVLLDGDESEAQLIRTIVEEYDNGAAFDAATSSFPFAGMLRHSVTTTAPVQNGLSDGGLPVSVTRFKTEVWNDYELAFSDAGRPFAVPVLTITEQSQEVEGIDGLLVRNYVFRPLAQFDEYGNQLGQETVAFDGDGFETARARTINEFYPRGQRSELTSGDPTRWEIGLLRKRTVITGSTSRTVRFEYDEDTGRLAKRVRAPGEPAFEQTSEFVYDDRGNLIQARSQAAGVVKDTVLEYDSSGLRLTAITGPSGLEALVQIDRNTGRPLTEVDPNGSAIQHIYDGFGREVRTISPTGTVETGVFPGSTPGVAYTVTRVQTDGLSTTGVSVQFDSMGRTLKSLSSGLDGILVEQNSEYTENGLPFSVELPHPAGEPSPGSSVRYYDDLGSIRAIATPGDTGQPTAVTAFEYATRYTVPAESLPERLPGEPPITFIARKIDPDGNVTTTYSGPLQQAVIRVEGEGDERQVSRVSYDDFGEVDELRGANNVMTIQRDAWGRTTSIADSDIGTLGYGYDAFDRVVSAIDADGTSSGYEYDVLDRLVRVVHDGEEERFIFDRDLEAEASGAPPAVNAVGRLVRSVRTTPNGTFSQTFSYEPPPTDGNALQNRALLDKVSLEGPGQVFETRYEYLPGTARVAIQHYPNSDGAGAFAVGYCYDEQGTVTHVLDALGPASCGDPGAGGTTPYWQRTGTFNGVGIDSVTLGNGVEWTAEFDPATLRLKGHTVESSSASFGFGYTYQPGGRLSRETRTGTGQGSLAFDRSYGYGGDGLLTSVSDAMSGESYDPTYNSGKQLLMGPANLGTFEYGGADGFPLGNRLTRVDPRPDDPDQIPHLFEYDGRGNQNHRSGPKIPGGEQSIGYNVFNLPDTITTGTGASAFTVAFDYDASGSRVRTLRPGAEIWHVAGIYEKELRENDPDFAEEHRYSVFAGGERVAQVVRRRGALDPNYAEDVTYLHYDRKGSVVGLSDSEGNMTELDYDLYGAPKQAMPVPWGYTGHRHEQDLALVDAGGRFYDPVFGVFLSADPISPLGGSSPRLNRYAYVGYDPVNFVDPTGFLVEDLWNAVRDFTVQGFAVTHILPTNLIATGRWETTWNEETWKGLLNVGIALGAGAVCGAVTMNPVVAGMCAGAVVGGIQAARSGGDWQDVVFGGILTGAVFGGFAGTAGGIANAAVYKLSGSQAWASLAASTASSGASVGAQLTLGGSVNWTQVAASAVATGVYGWVKGAHQDAEVGQAAGRAAGRASAAAAGHTRASQQNFDRRGFRGGIASARPQLLGYVTDANGRVLGQLDLLRYETAYRGVKIEMGYKDYGTGAQELHILQTVASDPPAGPAGSPIVDTDWENGWPWYPERALSRDSAGYDVVFWDAPARLSNAAGPVTWNAELSVVGRFDTHHHALITVQWGWEIAVANGPVILQPVTIVPVPSPFHLVEIR